MKRKLEKYIAAEGAITEFLAYDPESGTFTWKKRAFRSRKEIGEVAGARTPIGRIILKVRGFQLWGHQVAWWMVTGKWPQDEIDHINCDKSDNRFCNLREATRLENARNRKAYSRGGFGLKGAYFHPDGVWFGQIVVSGKQIYLGRFKSEMDAHLAYVGASKQYHGEFGRHD